MDVNRIYRYVVDHDMGFSPNPFFGVCTLANCKPVIRRTAKLGDLILGFGSAKSNIRHKLIYWMLVENIITFQEYWDDPNFEIKKPVVNGSHVRFHGDNIYHLSDLGLVVQEASFHSLPDGSPNIHNIKTDTGSTNRIIVSRTFGYYGKNAITVPKHIDAIVPVGRGHRVVVADDVKKSTIDWLMNNTERGFKGEPSGWEQIPT